MSDLTPYLKGVLEMQRRLDRPEVADNAEIQRQVEVRNKQFLILDQDAHALT